MQALAEESNPIKLLLIIEGSHYDPIRREDSLSRMGSSTLTRDSFIFCTKVIVIRSDVFFFLCEYVADGLFDYFTSIHPHTLIYREYCLN